MPDGKKVRVRLVGQSVSGSVLASKYFVGIAFGMCSPKPMNSDHRNMLLTTNNAIIHIDDNMINTNDIHKDIERD